MIMQLKSAALAESAIEISYIGKYNYAAAVIDDDGGTDNSPLITLGVSDTDLAAAVTAAQTVYTGTSSGDIQEVIAKINIWSDTTAAREVLEGQFRARQLNSLLNDSIYHATASKFEDDAGTTNNLKSGWYGLLTWDNDVDSTGFVTLRLPPEGGFHGYVAIKEISGHVGASGTPTITRSIYNEAGTEQWTLGSVATATDANLLKTFAEPVKFDGPVIVRDTSTADVTHVTGTTMSVMYGHVSATG